MAAHWRPNADQDAAARTALAALRAKFGQQVAPGLSVPAGIPDFDDPPAPRAAKGD
jgi:hypothetical protein